ncbi:hypothetical protein OAU04_02875 [Alphaproteobacteria bacterium]|nr:hypothetical protein [Alphaproteobacteria bacterium]
MLEKLHEAVREDIISYLNDEVLSSALESLPTDGTIDVFGGLGEEEQERLLSKISEDGRILAEQGVAYEEYPA